jgi:hypothetical protein
VRRALEVLPLLALLLAPVLAAAQEQYRGLPVAPYEIYEAIVGYAADQNFEALHKSLKHFPFLLQLLSTHCGTDLQGELETGLSHKDAAQTQRALMKMLFADFSLNLTQAVASAERAGRRERLEMAYVDLTFMAREASRRDPRVVEQTREALAVLAKTDDRTAFEAGAGDALRRLAATMPHCETGGTPR